MELTFNLDREPDSNFGDPSDFQDASVMKVTAIGTGDAFGSGGRFHTCWRLDAGGKTICVDFGAAAIVGWAKTHRPTTDIDAIVISHLHGDHFGGLPFLLLESQFVSRRRKPLLIVGPPGLEARLKALCEAMFANSSSISWSFPLQVREVLPGDRERFDGFDFASFEVVHPSGAPSTAVRVSAGGRTFAYSGDTAWVEALVEVARDADVFVCECYSGETPTPYHVDWPTLRSNLGRLQARSILVTHLGESALRKIDEIRAAGVRVAEDGLVFEV
jgi:ribonuclease BN (tRNA processing enzyme)